MSPQKFNLDSNHIIFASENRLKELVDTHLSYLGIGYFQYLRCYRDGSIRCLLSYTGVFKQFMVNDFPCFSSYEEDHEKEQHYWFLWDEELPWLPVKLARDDHKIYNGITLVRRFIDSYDMIAFAMNDPKENPAIFYMRKQKALYDFINRFEYYNRDLILQADCKKIMLPGDLRDQNYQELCLKKGDKHEVFWRGKNILLSSQELICFRLWEQKESYKDIANLLNVSPRTVETHLRRFKQKQDLFCT